MLISSPLLCFSLQIVQNGMIRHTTAGTGAAPSGATRVGAGAARTIPGPPASPGMGGAGDPPFPLI